MQTLEAAISQQTVGLVTRAEFAEKQKTLQEQIAAHQDKRKREELEAANKVRMPILPQGSQVNSIHLRVSSSRSLSTLMTKTSKFTLLRSPRPC